MRSPGCGLCCRIGAAVVARVPVRRYVVRLWQEEPWRGKTIFGGLHGSSVAAACRARLSGDSSDSRVKRAGRSSGQYKQTVSARLVVAVEIEWVIARFRGLCCRVCGRGRPRRSCRDGDEAKTRKALCCRGVGGLVVVVGVVSRGVGAKTGGPAEIPGSNFAHSLVNLWSHLWSPQGPQIPTKCLSPPWRLRPDQAKPVGETFRQPSTGDCSLGANPYRYQPWS